MLFRRVEKIYNEEKSYETKVERTRTGNLFSIGNLVVFLKKKISKSTRETELIEFSPTCFQLAKLRLSEDNLADSRD